MTFICNCFSAMLKLCHGVSFCDPSRNKLTHRQTSDVTHWFNFGPPHSLLNEVSMQDIASLQANQLNSLLLQTEAHTMILDFSDGKLQLAVRYFGNAKDRPLDSNLDPLEPSLTDLFPHFCSFKCTPRVLLHHHRYRHRPRLLMRQQIIALSNAFNELSHAPGPTLPTASPPTMI